MGPWSCNGPRHLHYRSSLSVPAQGAGGGNTLEKAWPGLSGLPIPPSGLPVITVLSLPETKAEASL